MENILLNLSWDAARRILLSKATYEYIHYKQITACFYDCQELDKKLLMCCMTSTRLQSQWAFTYTRAFCGRRILRSTDGQVLGIHNNRRVHTTSRTGNGSWCALLDLRFLSAPFPCNLYYTGFGGRKFKSQAWQAWSLGIVPLAYSKRVTKS